jgi:hypothetical protein
MTDGSKGDPFGGQRLNLDIPCLEAPREGTGLRVRACRSGTVGRLPARCVLPLFLSERETCRVSHLDGNFA